MPHINSYLKQLKKETVPFNCPHCNTSVTAQHFENHCAAQHQLGLDHCVWCFGNKTWSKNHKDVEHVTKCFAKFIKLQSRMKTILPKPVPSHPVQFDTTPVCEAGNAFGHAVHEGLPNKKIYPVNLVVRGLSFQDVNLNAAIASIQLYLDLAPKTDWHHIMVRAPAYSSFIDALEGKNVGTIPFSCFCAGGEEGLNFRDRQHRHLILITNLKGEFNRNIWKKINCHKKNSNIRKQMIESPIQLVNLIGCLSQRKTRCKFSFSDDEDSEVGEDLKFNIMTPLPPLYKLVLCMYFEGGLMEYIDQKYRNVDPRLLISAAENVGGLWGIRIQNLPGIEMGRVLPINKQFRPCTHSEMYLHLVNGRRMYFELIDQAGQEWEKDQACRGNTFFDCIGNDIWYPTPYQQKCISLAKPIQDQLCNVQIASEKKDEELHQSIETTTELKKENGSLKRKLEGCQEDFKKLQDKHIVLLERENDVLRMAMSKRMKKDEEEDEETSKA